MKYSQELTVGKNDIGFVSDFFKDSFKKELAEEIPGVYALGPYQTLRKRMTDAEIEKELKPRICSLFDVFAFVKNPPEGTKDGNYNIFYTPSFVVGVDWRAAYGDWRVRVWFRDGDWYGGVRIFSPATAPQALVRIADALEDIAKSQKELVKLMRPKKAKKKS